MEKIGAFSPENAKMILEVVRYLRANGMVINGGQKKDLLSPPDPAFPPIIFRNDSGEEIPPYACMQITGTDIQEDRTIFIVEKPVDIFGEFGPYLFNLHRPIEEDKYGTGDAGLEVIALSSSPTASAGTRFGPEIDSWSIVERKNGQFNQCGESAIGESTARILVGEAVKGFTIEFEITAISSSSSSEGSLGSSDDPLLCSARKKDAPSSVEARVTRRPCGVDVVPGEVDGFVTVVDSPAGKFLKDREASDLEGKQGFATHMSKSGDDSNSTSSGDDDCEWVITWIDWHVERQFVTDVIFGGNTITIERANAKVWDYCELPDEVIEGTDCVEASSAASS